MIRAWVLSEWRLWHTVEPCAVPGFRFSLVRFYFVMFLLMRADFDHSKWETLWDWFQTFWFLSNVDSWINSSGQIRWKKSDFRQVCSACGRLLLFFFYDMLSTEVLSWSGKWNWVFFWLASALLLGRWQTSHYTVGVALGLQLCLPLHVKADVLLPDTTR